jgi:hypothetical protein
MTACDPKQPVAIHLVLTLNLLSLAQETSPSFILAEQRDEDATAAFKDYREPSHGERQEIRHTDLMLTLLGAFVFFSQALAEKPVDILWPSASILLMSLFVR